MLEITIHCNSGQDRINNILHCGWHHWYYYLCDVLKSKQEKWIFISSVVINIFMIYRMNSLKTKLKQKQQIEKWPNRYIESSIKPNLFKYKFVTIYYFVVYVLLKFPCNILRICFFFLLAMIAAVTALLFFRNFIAWNVFHQFVEYSSESITQTRGQIWINLMAF